MREKKIKEEEKQYKVLSYPYPAKCPLGGNSPVRLKKDIKIRKLFLLTDSGIRFSNQEISEINNTRLKEARLFRKERK